MSTTLIFKQDPMSNIHWFPYIVVLVVLFVVLVFLAKRPKGLIKTPSKCRVIEQIPIHHKTKIFVIDYQGQKFLIADNQNALAIHPLKEDNTLS